MELQETVAAPAVAGTVAELAEMTAAREPRPTENHHRQVWCVVLARSPTFALKHGRAFLHTAKEMPDFNLLWCVAVPVKTVLHFCFQESIIAFCFCHVYIYLMLDLFNLTNGIVLVLLNLTVNIVLI